MVRELEFCQGDTYYSKHADCECVIVNPYQHNPKNNRDNVSAARIYSKEPLMIAWPGSAPVSDVTEVSGHIDYQDLEKGLERFTGVPLKLPQVPTRRKITLP